MGMRQGIGGVVADGPDIAQVVVQSFQFETETPEIAGAPGDLQFEQRFDGLTVGKAVSDGGIAGDPFGQRYGRPQRELLEQLLHTAVFPEMVEFEFYDGLASHREPEVSRLDDSGMDRTDRDLEDPFPFDVPKTVLSLITLQDRVPGKVFP